MDIQIWPENKMNYHDIGMYKTYLGGTPKRKEKKKKRERERLATTKGHCNHFIETRLTWLPKSNQDEPNYD